MQEPIAFIRQAENFIGLNPRGWGNGYVAIPPEHPLHGVDYADERMEFVEIHGGLTFAANSSESGLSKWLTKKGVPEGWWVFGFDTAHYGDNEVNCDEEFVKQQTENLKEQLESYNTCRITIKVEAYLTPQQLSLSEVLPLKELLASAVIYESKKIPTPKILRGFEDDISVIIKSEDRFDEFKGRLNIEVNYD